MRGKRRPLKPKHQNAIRRVRDGGPFVREISPAFLDQGHAFLDAGAARGPVRGGPDEEDAVLLNSAAKGAPVWWRWSRRDAEMDSARDVGADSLLDADLAKGTTEFALVRGAEGRGRSADGALIRR